MVRLILGRAGTGKTARVFREIAEKAGAGTGGLVLLVPEQYSHEAERELCRAVGDRLSLYGEVLSFTGLARRVFSQCGGSRPVMDGGGRLLCMAVAAETVSDSLRVYQRGVRDAHTLDSLVRAADELKNAGITPDAMAEAAAGLPGALGEKLRDLSLLLEAYTAAESRSAADPADILERLAELIGGSDAAKGIFYVDGFSDFTELEKRVLRELIRAGTEITVCLSSAPAGETEVFSLPDSTARWLRSMAEEYGREFREEWMEPAGDDSSLSWFAGRMFDFSETAVREAAGSVRLVTASEPYEECELAASRMAELARAGSRWREMAVAVRGFGDYRTALESACARYGVPLFLSGRGDMLRRSVPRLIASALESVVRGYEYEAVFGYLKTGLSPISLEECDQLENYAIVWNIHGTMWERPFTMHPDGYNQKFDDAANTKLEEMNTVRIRVIAPLRKLENAVKAAETASAQAQALADFLTDIRLPQRLETRAEELERSGRQEAAAEYERLWELICTALEQFAAVLGDMQMDADRFRELFCLMLSKYDVGIIPVSLDRVQAGDIDGMRRRHIRHLFVLGASDGRLPAPEQGGGVFTPDEREELTALGLPLGGAEEELSRELWRIYSCLSLPSESLWLSWPETDIDGSEARPSMIVGRAEAMFGLHPERGDILRARTFSREAAFALSVRGEAGYNETECLAAREFFIAEGRGEELAGFVKTASAGRGKLSPESVAVLYGDRPALSATRAQRFAECRFSYFLQYGIKAKPREPAVFDPRDYGTFMHYVLENVARRAMEEGGFAAVSRERIGELTDETIDRYITEELSDFAEKTARFEYLFRRLRTMVRRVTEDMWEELRVSRFQPLDFELDLTQEGVLEPSEDSDIRLTGQADRVDGWVKDDVLYLRITDYKTGVKRFSLSDICEGMNLQMLLYLFTLEKRGKSYFGVSEIRPAGVLYSPARVETVRAEGEVSDEELASLRGPGTRRSGLVLADRDVIEAMEPGEQKQFLPVKFKKDGSFSAQTAGSLATLEQFGALGSFIEETIHDMAAELRSGSVDADPWYKNSHDNACTYCEFAKACMFDEGRDAWRLRTSLKPEEAWERIGGGDE